MNPIVEILMKRDSMTQEEAEELLEIGRAQVYEDGEDPEDVLLNEFGLEPDYVFDLITDDHYIERR